MALDENVHSSIVRAFHESDKQLNSNYTFNTEASGSTCVSVLVAGNKCLCANLGDSCAGILKQKINETWEIEMMNREHKPTEEDEKRRVENCGGRIEPFRGR
jgi:serine/threonine protein phosphatase PrpC